MDRVGEYRATAEATGPVVDVEIVERVGKQPRHLLDLAAVLREVRLPVRAGGCGERRRFAQQVRRTRDREAGGDRVAQSAGVGAMPAFDQRRALAQALVEDHLRVDG